MSASEFSDSDTSYHPVDDEDLSGSDDYLSYDSAIDESDEDDLFTLDGGWAHVNVYIDNRPDPLPPLRQPYSYFILF